MRSDDLISVVIPARNAAGTLEKALQSLVRQGHRHWEAVVVDDGSTDETAAIVRRLADQDDRIRIVSGPARGASAARNRGIAEVAGQWLQFLDADDWLEPDHLERMLAALRANPEAKVAWCSYRRVMLDGREDGVKTLELNDDPFPQLCEQCTVAIHGVLVDLELVRSVGGFDEELVTCEDWDLWQRVARTGAPWTGVPDLIVPYLVDPRSLSNRATSLLRDGMTVIERGAAPDPRVPEPALRWSKGLSAWGSDTAHRRSRFALWVLSSLVAGGKPVDFDTSVLAGLSRDPWLGGEIGYYIFDGLVIGLQTTGERLLLASDKVGPAIRTIMDEVARHVEDPMALRRIEHSLDDLLLEGEWQDGQVLARTLLVERERGFAGNIALPEGIDRVHCRLVNAGRSYAAVTIGALDAINANDIEDALAASFHGRQLSNARLRAAARALVPAGLKAPLKRAVRSGPARRLIDTAWKIRRRLGRARPVDHVAPSASPHRLRLAELEQALAADLPSKAPAVEAAKNEDPARSGDRGAFWEAIFASPDPWNYDSPYEAQKYERQLELLPDRPIRHALELASAEGHFTHRLASRVAKLTATDISPTALERNRARQAQHHDNIEFRTLDLVVEKIPSGHDLIICSEVLYYLDDYAQLRMVAGKIADALEPGGAFLTAHAFVSTDDRTRTGFDWGHPFGAEGIARTFAETPGLALEESIQTEIYRVDRFRKLAAGENAEPPVVRAGDVCEVLDPDVERYLLRGGADVLRSDVAGELADRVPILMYHGVADIGPEALARYRTAPAKFLEQVRWLRRNGYHTLSPARLAEHLANRRPFHGRPVVITFDDGIANFAEHAWPILRAHDFEAEMFLVTGLVGGTAEWDGEDGRQIPLLDLETIRRLAAEGVRFGSHFTRHVPANGLSSEELAHEMIASRLQIESWLGTAPVQLAAPYTIPDRRFPAMARSTGYSLLYGNGSGPAGWWQSPCDLPRIEIPGDWSMDQFVAALEAAR